MAGAGDNNLSSAAIPTIPVDLFGDDRWMSVHRRFVMDAQEKEPDVLFVGDSIISYLSYTEYWDTHFSQMHSLNFGIGGERTENVLWRVSNGELDHMNLKAIVVLVGTNNHGNTAPEIADGIEAIVQVCREKQPHALVFVLKLLPRGERPNDNRSRNSTVNTILEQRLLGKENVQLVNIDPGFVQPDGTIKHHDMWDYLHLTKSGYCKAFEPVYELLQQLLVESDQGS